VEKHWEILNKTVVRTRSTIATRVGRDSQESVVETLLKNRKIKDREVFFNPPAPGYLVTQLPSYLPDLDLEGLHKAVERIKRAITSKEKIVIWGDYDVDGVCATAILWQAITDLGGEVLPYIPDRFTEGYGLNRQGIEKLVSQGTNLMLTVDTGVVAYEEIEFAHSLGLDVIVTDHHLKSDRSLSAYAIVHTTSLCGAGVAWVLASQLNNQIRLPDGQATESLNNHLDLVAIATIADIQSLLGANRSLVRAGLEILNKAQRPGIAALTRVASLKLGEIGSWGVGWVLAPRINAIGRMEKGIEALRLLLTKNEVEAGGLAHKLDEANVRRHALTVDTLEHAKTMVVDGEIIVVYDDSWHEGIIGLVAGRLVEEYGRPAVVIAKGEKISRGSARSVNGINIVELLRSVPNDLLADVGGHEAAAGFTLATDKLEQFVSSLKEKSTGIFKNQDMRPLLKIDCVLPLDKVDLELLEKIARFEPFGIGNPEPVFLAEQALVIKEERVGKEKQHLKLRLSPSFEALWFGRGDQPPFSPGEEVDLVYTPKIDRFNGRKKITLRVHDLRRK